jgi:hypothetical protein
MAPSIYNNGFVFFAVAIKLQVMKHIFGIVTDLRIEFRHD